MAVLLARPYIERGAAVLVEPFICWVTALMLIQAPLSVQWAEMVRELLLQMQVRMVVAVAAGVSSLIPLICRSLDRLRSLVSLPRPAKPLYLEGSVEMPERPEE